MIADESLITELTATIRHAMNEPKKHRQSIRLKGYDYRLNGAYYITICSYQKQYLFGEIVEGNMEQNLLGDTIEAVWYRLPLNFNNYYEHIIRNENSYQKIRQYILDNPRNWEQDENNLNKFKPM